MTTKKPIYYKSTRMDGTDWHTGKVEYVPGYVYTVYDVVGAPKLCTDRVIHATTQPGNALIVGEWPCRMFRVEGEVVAGGPDEQYGKVGFVEMDVVEEVEGWLALGGNGEQVKWWLGRMETLTEGEVKAIWERAWERARERARARAWERARARAWERARARAWERAWERAWAPERARAYSDAATALVVRDLITPADFTTLYQPVLDVVGLPPVFDSTPIGART